MEIVGGVPILPDRFVTGGGEHGCDLGWGTLVGHRELFEGFGGAGGRDGRGWLGGSVASGVGAGTSAHVGDAEAVGVITKGGRFAGGKSEFKFVVEDAEGTEELDEVPVGDMDLGLGLPFVRPHAGEGHGVGGAPVAAFEVVKVKGGEAGVGAPVFGKAVEAPKADFLDAGGTEAVWGFQTPPEIAFLSLGVVTSVAFDVIGFLIH